MSVRITKDFDGMDYISFWSVLVMIIYSGENANPMKKKQKLC
jgi:hypothetical protein